MKALLLTAFVLLFGISNAQTTNKMKLNAGIITEKLQETKKFYTEVLDFGVSFENEFYLLLHTPNNSAEISFLQPNHPSRSEEHTSELQSRENLVCRLLLEKKNSSIDFSNTSNSHYTLKYAPDE